MWYLKNKLLKFSLYPENKYNSHQQHKILQPLLSPEGIMIRSEKFTRSRSFNLTFSSGWLPKALLTVMFMKKKLNWDHHLNSTQFTNNFHIVTIFIHYLGWLNLNWWHKGESFCVPQSVSILFIVFIFWSSK